MSAIKIGQRWHYKGSSYDFIAEVVALPIKHEMFGWDSVKCIVVEWRRGTTYTVGTTHNFHPFPNDTEQSNYCDWTYLSGQDRPV